MLSTTHSAACQRKFDCLNKPYISKTQDFRFDLVFLKAEVDQMIMHSPEQVLNAIKRQQIIQIKRWLETAISHRDGHASCGCVPRTVRESLTSVRTTEMQKHSVLHGPLFMLLNPNQIMHIIILRFETKQHQIMVLVVYKWHVNSYLCV